MNEQRTSKQPGTGPASARAPAPSPSQPNISVESMQHLLDQAAYCNLLSIPGTNSSTAVVNAPGNSGSVIGFRINEVLHRFEVTTEPPNRERGVVATSVVGEAIGQSHQRWMPIPQRYEAAPGREPPPTPLAPSQSQCFVMLDATYTFGDSKDGFRGFGTGFTVPAMIHGRSRLDAVAVGTIREGFGQLRGHNLGAYVYAGTIAPEHGFTGNLLLRVMYPEGTIHTESTLPPSEPRRDSAPGITYFVTPGQAREEQVVKPVICPDGQLQGLQITLPGAPGVQALPFGNIGRIASGTGSFKGINRLATDNLLVSFVPHVSAGYYVLRINDPDGRYRAAIDGG